MFFNLFQLNCLVNLESPLLTLKQATIRFAEARWRAKSRTAPSHSHNPAFRPVGVTGI